MTPEETFTASLNEDLRYEARRLEIWGPDGVVPAGPDTAEDQA